MESKEAAAGPPEPTASGVVLAGGSSTRFARGDKALATVDGEPLLARVARAIRAATGRPPVVAVRTPAQRETYEALLPGPVAFAHDVPERAGPLAGLAGAVEVTRTPWLFVVACDMPRLEPAAVRWVLARAGGANAVVPVSPDGRRQPLHAGYRRGAVREALEGLDADASLQGLLDAVGTVRTVAVADAPQPVPLEASIANVNTRAELAAARAARRD